MHRRRIDLEDKAKVVASDWWTESLLRQLFCFGLFETNGWTQTRGFKCHENPLFNKRWVGQRLQLALNVVSGTATTRWRLQRCESMDLPESARIQLTHSNFPDLQLTHSNCSGLPGFS